MRIASLIASSTEIVCALGFENSLVARSHECDYPPSVKSLPVVTEAKVQADVSSAEIDRSVKDILRLGLSVYRVDADKLRELRPDVVITQTHCEVCAVSLKDVEVALKNWLGRPRLVPLAPNALADVWTSIRMVAEALEAPERGEELVARLQRRMCDIAEKTRALAPKPTVAYIEWIDPLMAGGNWMPELIEMAGGVNLFGEAGRHSPWMTFDDLCAKNPDVIFIAPCGFDIMRTQQEMPVITSQPGWRELKAVRNGRVYVADGNQFFNRPGPRVVESLEILAEVLHPAAFSFGHRDAGWTYEKSAAQARLGPL